MRGFDRDIAEKVMGWTNIESDEVSLYGTPPEPIEHPPQYEGTGEGRFHVPRYSTEIRAAWKVARRMQELGHGITLRSHAGIDGICREGWECAFMYDGYVNAPTVQEAICNAALKCIALMGVSTST